MAVNELEWLTGAAKGKKLILEIGSWKGRSSKAIVEGMLPGSMLMCMDTWRGSDNEELHDIAKSPEDPIYKEFCTNLRYEIETGMVVPLRMDSTDGLKHLASLGMKFDMIFLDANHSFEGVSSDCRNAIPLLAPGGLMCGHDWCPAWSTVIAAVNDVFPGRCRPVTGTIWTAEP
jgi:predicted O-methyltransferase YrrM